MPEQTKLDLEGATRGAKAKEFPGVKQQEEAKAREMAAANIRDDAEKKAIRNEEDDNKRILLAREETNFTKIYALKCYNGWLKICDNSAVILGKAATQQDRYDDHAERENTPFAGEHQGVT